ncbi:hypothetical protein C8Q80DRAFT_1161383 [Daedaleopsis nitida]|nr:hypothetical protein C8Q80DRAFT_1161383 [Daedaleopsis nitida]
MSADTDSALRPPLAIPAQRVIDIDESDDDEDVVFMGYARRNPTSATTEALENEGLAYMGYNLNLSGRSSPSGGAHAGSSRSARTEGTTILNSDDDNEPSSSRSGQTSRGRRTRLISPPPPRAQRGHTPAVPPLPRHLLSQASIPLARRASHRAIQVPRDPPPIIRPSEQPLPFERMTSLPRLPARNSSTANSSAPRSHHQPAMGFGGALLAFNRQNALDEANRRERDREARFGLNLPSFSDMFRRLSGYGGSSHASDGARVDAPNSRRWHWSFFDQPAEEVDHLFDEVELFPDLAPMFGIPSKAAPLQKVVHWKPEYTHPDKPGAGFTSDFSPGENSSSTSSGPSSPGVIELDEDHAGPSNAGSSSSSASSVETTLVCARCLDPLVLAAPNAVPDEERKKYRVWALRCGHMLDGKCIAELMSPPPPPSVEPPQEECSGKGKGKARAVEPEPADVVLEDVHIASTASDRKGKRKAVEPLDHEPSPKRPAVDESVSQVENPIRSRLRPRTRAGPDTPAGGSAASFEPATVALPLSASVVRRSGRGSAARAAAVEGDAHTSRTKGKGKGRAKAGPKLAIEAEHEWRCPVGGCGRVHYSVRVEGEWRNDEGRGAIALFV